MTTCVHRIAEVADERPDESQAPYEIIVGDVVVIRRAVQSPYPYIAYAASKPRVWQNLLWGRSDWSEVCHLLGIYPCRIECLRNPASWPGEFPEGFCELTDEEVVQVREAQRDGRSLVSNRRGSPSPSKPPADPRAPQPVIAMEVGRSQDPRTAVDRQIDAIAQANEASDAVRKSGGSDADALRAYDQVIEASDAWATTGRVPTRRRLDASPTAPPVRSSSVRARPSTAQQDEEDPFGLPPFQGSLF